MSNETKNLAERFFDAYVAYQHLEEDAYEALAKACGTEYDGDDCPFEEITHDSYDMSFEFKQIKGDWCPTPEQLQACWDLGFKRCWLCYDDGSEISAAAGYGMSKRHKRNVA